MKRALHALFAVAALPVVVPIWLLSRRGDGDALLASCSQALSLLPGKFGSYYRAACYRRLMSYCSQDVVIGFGTLFSQRDTEIHSGVYIGPQCNIGSARINQDCLLGSGVHLLSGKQQHCFEALDVPIREQGGTLTRIDIGVNTWIGNGSLIMADVGPECVIGAGSVVTDPIPARSVVAGNPARVIRTRI